MLDFRKLKTPAEHGHVLLAPEPAACVAAVRHNGGLLRGWNRTVLGAPLAHWRTKTRCALAGGDVAPVIVVGHQPAFIHPGVWAKHIVAQRLAEALDGVAINIVVDNDAPRDTTIHVPVTRGETLSVTRVPFASVPHGFAYEQIAAFDKNAIAGLDARLRDAMGSQFEHSMLPAFLNGFTASRGSDWVDQAVAGRRAIESGFGVSVLDHRISRVWCSPLLIDMLEHARRFATAYNHALHNYRVRHRVRGVQRPIPDLHIDDRRCELPVWIYRPDDQRRRLFVQRDGDAIRLFADDVRVAEAHASALECNEQATALVDGLDEWLLRPRALTLTLWARLLLADLFIHGIGGAKYDRITDEIIATYYDLDPPRMACVSATLLLDLPGLDGPALGLRDARREARDVRFNPQRHLESSPAVGPLLERRDAAVARAAQLKRDHPRDRSARRAAFGAIRNANSALLQARPGVLAAAERNIQEARRAGERQAIARNREYFFGLYARETLQKLVDALPGVQEFRL